MNKRPLQTADNLRAAHRYYSATTLDKTSDKHLGYILDGIACIEELLDELTETYKYLKELKCQS